MIDYNDYVELFRIVPVNDGFHYMCMNCFGQFYLAHKVDDPTSREALIFETEELAQLFIDKHFEKDCTIKIYKPEFVLYCKNRAPTNIIREVIK